MELLVPVGQQDRCGTFAAADVAAADEAVLEVAEVTVSEGDAINIENVSVASFRGELQLRIGKGGTLSTVR